MIRELLRRSSLVAVLAVGVASGACNDVADCPSASSIHPGGSCSGYQLQCPYDLAASDGTTTATSCTCISGSWSCPTASADDASSGGDDGSSAPQGDAGSEAASPSPEASLEAGE
jgi:hypothetical protein